MHHVGSCRGNRCKVSGAEAARAPARAIARPRGLMVGKSGDVVGAWPGDGDVWVSCGCQNRRPDQLWGGQRSYLASGWGLCRCSVPRFDGAILSLGWKEAPWDKFFMADRFIPPPPRGAEFGGFSNISACPSRAPSRSLICLSVYRP